MPSPLHTGSGEAAHSPRGLNKYITYLSERPIKGKLSVLSFSAHSYIMHSLGMLTFFFFHLKISDCDNWMEQGICLKPVELMAHVASLFDSMVKLPLAVSPLPEMPSLKFLSKML